MSNFSDWPTCVECTNRRRATHGDDSWCPVEEYGVEIDDRAGLLNASGRYTCRAVVVAKCSHGNDFHARHVRESRSEPIDCPAWWNVDRANPLASHYLRAAVRSLRFFGPGEARPAHRMVTLVH